MPQNKAAAEAQRGGTMGMGAVDEETPMPKPVHCIKDAELRVYLQLQFQVCACVYVCVFVDTIAHIYVLICIEHQFQACSGVRVSIY